MNNRPFFSTNTNVYDQNMFSAAPTNFNGQNVLISQEQQRKIFDTLNTSIVGVPFENSPTNNHFVQAQKQFVPGGVVFSFNPQPLPQPQGFMMQQMPYPNPNNMNGYYPSSLEQQIAASGLQKHGLESLNYQQQLASNPFQLKFHLNISTSCSDLLSGLPRVPASSSTSVVRNITDTDFLQNQEQRNKRPVPNNSWLSCNVDFPSPTFDSFRTIKRLNLHQQPVQQKSRVNHALKPNDNNNIPKTKRMVSFADEHQNDTKEDKWSQISCRCKCNGSNDKADKKKKAKPKNSKKTKKKKEKKEISESSSDSSESSSDSNEEDQLSCCPNILLNNEQKSKERSDSQYYSTDE